jgi:protein-disulfide isomerase
MTNTPNSNLGTKPTPTGVETKVDIKDVDIGDDPYIGNKNAPVVMAFWSDYQCPFCKKTEVEVFPTLIEDYVETGKLKIVFLDFVFLGQDSVTASVFDHAVWELYPEYYFTWREKMFASQDAEGGPRFW